MGAGGLLGKRQHIDAAGRAQRHDSAEAKYGQKLQKIWFFALEQTPHPNPLPQGERGKKAFLFFGLPARRGEKQCMSFRKMIAGLW